MRSLTTIAVVSAQFEKSLRALTPEAVERLLIDSRNSGEFAFFRCLLDTWDPSQREFLRWLEENRPPACTKWRRLVRANVVNVLFFRRDGRAFLPRPSTRDISRWYHKRSLGEDDFQAFVAALYDALQMHLATKCTLVVACRILGPTLGDEEYRPKRKTRRRTL
jgi:hypothetical protein